MANQEDWFKPSVIKNARIRITIMLGLIVALMVYINHNWLIKIFNQIISSI